MHIAPFFSFSAALALSRPPAFAGARSRQRSRGSRLLVAAVALCGFSLAILDPPIAYGLAIRLASSLGMREVRSCRGETWPTSSTPRRAPPRWGVDLLASRISGGSVYLLTVQQGVLYKDGSHPGTPDRCSRATPPITPRLAELDRAFFAGASAPEWLLVRWYRIDGRLPSLEDGPALLEILARYRPVGRGEGLPLDAPRARRLRSVQGLGPVLWQGRLQSWAKMLALARHGGGTAGR